MTIASNIRKGARTDGVICLRVVRNGRALLQISGKELLYLIGIWQAHRKHHTFTSSYTVFGLVLKKSRQLHTAKLKDNAPEHASAAAAKLTWREEGSPSVRYGFDHPLECKDRARMREESQTEMPPVSRQFPCEGVGRLRDLA
jgi:hypothetical protein